jgi:hypothetical protein
MSEILVKFAVNGTRLMELFGVLENEFMLAPNRRIDLGIPINTAKLQLMNH